MRQYLVQPRAWFASSETVGQSNELFSLLDKKWKIFSRNPSNLSVHPTMEFPQSPPNTDLPAAAPSSITQIKQIDTLGLVKTILAQSDLAPCVLIDSNADIIYIHGRTGNYLEPPEGETSIIIMQMARPGLKGALISGIRKLNTEKKATVIKNIQVQRNGDFTKVKKMELQLQEKSTK